MLGGNLWKHPYIKSKQTSYHTPQWVPKCLRVSPMVESWIRKLLVKSLLLLPRKTIRKTEEHYQLLMLSRYQRVLVISVPWDPPSSRPKPSEAKAVVQLVWQGRIFVLKMFFKMGFHQLGYQVAEINRIEMHLSRFRDLRGWLQTLSRWVEDTVSNRIQGSNLVPLDLTLDPSFL